MVSSLKLIKFISCPIFLPFITQLAATPVVYGTPQVHTLRKLNLSTSVRAVRLLPLSRSDGEMAGRDVQWVLDESATVACHHIWLLGIGHLPITAEVFDASGGPNL